MKPAIFLDRDGVINENRSDYVKSWEEFTFLPGSLEALKQLASSPWLVVIITNQSVVGREIITMHQLDAIHSKMLQAIHAAGGRIDAIYTCPHAPSTRCACRKPSPDLLLRASKDLNINLLNSMFIGDSLSDIEAARRAKVLPIFVRSGREAHLATPDFFADCLVFNDLLSATAKIVKNR